jgi:hypothetical protein
MDISVWSAFGEMHGGCRVECGHGQPDYRHFLLAKSLVGRRQQTIAEWRGTVRALRDVANTTTLVYAQLRGNDRGRSK